MNKADREALTLVVKTLYPYQPRYLSIPFSWAKRKLMKAAGLNRWDFDKWILDLQAQTTSKEDGFVRAFYLPRCGLRQSSRLNYVSTARRGEETFENSYCFLQFDLRNKYMRAILAELEKSKDA